jgi:hypothetical protein
MHWLAVLQPLVQANRPFAQYCFLASAAISFLATVTLAVFAFPAAVWVPTGCVCLLSVGLMYSI